ncbi:MAG: GerMN domain-containing protein [Lachnospiraceae bacterium]|nr:GerMN domain-containing protein [Lachnospiraceae bacterium]
MSVIAVALFLTACNGALPLESGANSKAAEELQVYYLNQEENQILGEAYGLGGEEADYKELLNQLQRTPANPELKCIMGSKTKLKDLSLEDGELFLDFDKGYRDLESIEEVLFRASLVHTLTQDSRVNSISISVEGEELKDQFDNPVGAMDQNSFIDDAAKELDAYAKKTMRLYFADVEGTGLIPVEEKMVYSTNASLEKLVMEKLIQGPGRKDVYPTIPPETKLISIHVKDGTCYVSLDTTVIDKPIDVSEEVVLYSIVDSLVELPDISRVQLIINGETDRTLRTEFSLNNVYGPDYSMVRR